MSVYDYQRRGKWMRDGSFVSDLTDQALKMWADEAIHARGPEQRRRMGERCPTRSMEAASEALDRAFDRARSHRHRNVLLRDPYGDNDRLRTRCPRPYEAAYRDLCDAEAVCA